jgi:YVTN family beta-propeller protein
MTGGREAAAAGAITAMVYVANEDDGTISVIDADRNAVVATIGLSRGKAGTGPMSMAHNVQVAPDGKSVWVTAPPMEGMAGHGSSEDEVVVIDAATNAITHRISVGKDQHLAHVVLDAASRYAYVTAYEGNAVLKIDALKFQVVDTIHLGKGKGPHGERLCADQLYVAEMDGKQLAILNTSTGKVEEIPIGGTAVQTACTRDGKYVFVTLFDTREVARYDVKTKAIKRIVMPKGAQGPVQLYISPDDKTVYVADQGILMNRPASNELFAIDVQGGSVTGATHVGKGPHGVVVGPSGKFAYVTNVADDTVSVVDLKSRKVTGTVKVGKRPNGISTLTP